MNKELYLWQDVCAMKKEAADLVISRIREERQKSGFMLFCLFVFICIANTSQLSDFSLLLVLVLVLVCNLILINNFMGGITNGLPAWESTEDVEKISYSKLLKGYHDTLSKNTDDKSDNLLKITFKNKIAIYLLFILFNIVLWGL